MHRRMLEAAGGLIRLVTLSPEWPGAPRFIEALVGMSVVGSIGHTRAMPRLWRIGLPAVRAVPSAEQDREASASRGTRRGKRRGGIGKPESPARTSRPLRGGAEVAA